MRFSHPGATTAGDRRHRVAVAFFLVVSALPGGPVFAAEPVVPAETTRTADAGAAPAEAAGTPDGEAPRAPASPRARSGHSPAITPRTHDREEIVALPIPNEREVLGLAATAPGIVVAAGEPGTIVRGPALSSHGASPRANHFTIDGQDANDPSLGGRQQPVRNPDAAASLRVVTARFSAAPAPGSGALVELTTRRGTSRVHGSAFWLGNRTAWNSRSNLDEAAGRAGASHHSVDKWGGDLGGPLGSGRTTFFASYQRWTDRALGPSRLMTSVPTLDGRRLLGAVAGDRPAVQALLEFLPEADEPSGRTARFSVGGRRYDVPLGTAEGWADLYYESHEALARLDHHIDATHHAGVRYLLNDDEGGGFGQVAPRFMFTNEHSRQQMLAAWLTSRLSPSVENDLRIGFSRSGVTAHSRNTRSAAIPSLEVLELGLTGAEAGPQRTGLGLAIDLPWSRRQDVLQLRDTVSFATGRHSWTVGLDVRRTQVESTFNPGRRGRLVYPTLQALVDDVADVATVNLPLPGGSDVLDQSWFDTRIFLHDEVRLGSGLTLGAGLAWVRPGDWLRGVRGQNGRIVHASGDESLDVVAARSGGAGRLLPSLSLAAGAGPIVVRAGWSRLHDLAFADLARELGTRFPQVVRIEHAGPVAGAWDRVRSPGEPTWEGRIARTGTADRLDVPTTDQLGAEVHAALSPNVTLRAAWVRARGHDLFRMTEADWRPAAGGVSDRMLSTTGRSWFDGVELGVRYGVGGLTGSVHGALSSAFDDGSDVLGVAPADPPRAAEKARSSWDRPRRLHADLVWSVPGDGPVAGGWQIGALAAWQSGAPFSVLDASGGTHVASRVDLDGFLPGDVLAAGGGALFTSCGPADACVPLSRNVLRSSSHFRLDVALSKTTRLHGDHAVQVRLDAWNLTSHRNYDVPEARVGAPGFLDEGLTDGGRRRVWLSARYLF